MSQLAQNLAGVEHQYSELKDAFGAFVKSLAATFNENEHFPSVKLTERVTDAHISPIADLYLLGARFELAFSMLPALKRIRGVLRVSLVTDPPAEKQLLLHRFFDRAKNVTRSLDEGFSDFSLDERDFHVRFIADLESAYLAWEMGRLPPDVPAGS
jgi:hypothetical protein